MPGAPLVLFYNAHWGEWPDTAAVDCGCGFTSDLRLLADARAVVFHLPTLRNTELPPKPPGQVWVGWSMESAVHDPRLDDAAFMRNFEATVTHRQASTIWNPYFGPPTARDLLRPLRPKTESTPVVHMQSSPIDRSGRIRYAAELMKRVKVDSFGAILRNRTAGGPGPPRSRGNARGRESMMKVASRYKFTLVFENAVEDDYVSDKFFDTLIAGSVPVYRGAPNVAALAPASRCYIDTADFSGPAELAAYLNHLDTSPEYDGYLEWKSGGLASSFLELVELVREHPLRRLCDHLRRMGSPPAPAGPGSAHADAPTRDR